MFPRRQRLAASAEVNRTLKQRPYFSDLFILKFNQSKGVNPKFAVIVSTKVSKLAVERNRMKRQTRQCLKEIFKDVNEGVDIAITVKKKLPNKYESIMRDLVFLLNKAFILCR